MTRPPVPPTMHIRQSEVAQARQRPEIKPSRSSNFKTLLKLLALPIAMAGIGGGVLEAIFATSTGCIEWYEHVVTFLEGAAGGVAIGIQPSLWIRTIKSFKQNRLIEEQENEIARLENEIEELLRGSSPTLNQMHEDPNCITGACYRIKEVGEGGMAYTIMTEDRMSHERAVFKVPKMEVLKSQENVARFLREVISNLRLEHPGVVKFKEFKRITHDTYDRLTGISIKDDLKDRVPEDIPCLVMEFIPYATLDEVLRENGGILPVHVAVKIGIEIAKTLRDVYQHEDRELIHRDIKPENVFVDYDSETQTVREVKIGDFGLAKALTASTQVTADDSVFGTPQYMSPEQCGARTDLYKKGVAPEDQIDPVNWWSDMYAVGATIYEMVSGEPPYGVIENGTRPIEYLRKIVGSFQQGGPPDIRTRPGMREVENIDALWDTSLRYMLAYNFENRFQEWDHAIYALENLGLGLENTVVSGS